MPRFYFDIKDMQGGRDDTGTDIQNTAAARIEAVKFAGSYITDHAENFWQTGMWTLEVTDASRLVLFRLDFSSADALLSQA